MQTNKKAKITSASNARISPTSKPPLHAAKRPLIDADAVSVVLAGETILESVSLCIHEGECIGLIGPNGAGKTTLLKALLGLIPVTSGKITRYKGAIGYIPQRGALGDGQLPISVLEVVRLGSNGNSTVAQEALQAVKMSEFITKRFAELSGGQQQRVLIAKALAASPRLLILDEPTTGIDERSQTDFYHILTELQAKGIAITMVSHDIDAVLRQVKRVICLNRSILYDGPPEHFEADKYLPDFYVAQHRLLHHQHGVGAHHA